MADKYALIRVSTEDQNEARQVIKMKELGIPTENIVIEKESGKSKVRTKYRKLVKRLKSGDILYIENIDRLSRDYIGIISEWHRLTVRKGIIIKILDTPILDTDQNDNGLLTRFVRNILLHIFAFNAELVWQRIKSSQRQGIDVMPVVNGKKVSTKTNRPTGRPKAVRTEYEIKIAKQYLNREIDLDTALNLLDKKKTAFYNLCRGVSGDYSD